MIANKDSNRLCQVNINPRSGLAASQRFFEEKWGKGPYSVVNSSIRNRIEWYKLETANGLAIDGEYSSNNFILHEENEEGSPKSQSYTDTYQPKLEHLSRAALHA